MESEYKSVTVSHLSHNTLLNNDKNKKTFYSFTFLYYVNFKASTWVIQTFVYNTDENNI